MKKLNSLQDSSLEKNDSQEPNRKDNESNGKLEKVLCNYCGRTKNNGIRCLGICVSDNDY